MNNILFWFRNDLRLHDNEALVQACEKGNVIPVYVIEPRNFRKTSIGFKRTGPYRAEFLLQSLEDLKKSLQAIGSDLVVKIGKTADIVAELAEAYEVSHVYCSKEVTQEETNLEYEVSQLLKPLNIDMEMVWGATLYHVLDLPFQVKFLPDIFTDFRKKLENHSKVRPVFDTIRAISSPTGFTGTSIPKMKDLGFDEKPELIFKGGETQGLQRVKDYVWGKDLLQNYKLTRNGLLGMDYSSKFSPWLSLGCVSPRYIYEQVSEFERIVIKNESTYWLIFELVWRDYFHFVALKYGIRLFKRSGIKHVMNQEWRGNKKDFEKWCNGTTGVPFVDANMKELNETGFMSNRGRQIVASFLTKDLRLEWWWGAMYFENMLIDYDVCSNWGNWNYIAGIGNDPRPNRYFNILKQAEKYDADGLFVQNWLPELKKLDKKEVHAPWLSPKFEQLNYPKPMLDVSSWT